MGANESGAFSPGSPTTGIAERGNMKTIITLLTVAFGASITTQTATASQMDAGISKAAMSTDISAAKKKKKKRYQAYVYPQQYGYYYPPAFTPADPSYQSPELRRLRALNRCVIDLGYGRWENCD